MSKELPYFRFYINEWLNDDISFTNYRVKGVFADVCSMYWFRDCSITKAMLEQRIPNATEELEELVNMSIIKVDKNDNVTIKFLDEQFDKLSEKRKKRVEAGRKGGLARSINAKAKVKQSSSYKDKEKDKEKDKDNIPFSDFWDAYGKKVGSKSKAEKKWNKIKETEQEYIMKHIEAYVNKFDDKQFQPYPTTFLNGKNWEAEDFVNGEPEFTSDMYDQMHGGK